MDRLKDDYSVRKVCATLGLRRASYYHRKKGNRPEKVDQQIADLLHLLVNTYVAWGFWMIYHYIRKQGFNWNHKRIWRIWKQEALSKRKKPQRKKIKREYQDLIAPEKINEGWAVDFMSDFIVKPNGQSIRIINVIDECSRRALWTTAHISISATVLIKELTQLAEWRGKPAYIRCDNGPEFIAQKLKDWAEDQGIELRYTQPGKPTQNGIIERLNGTLRTECLNLEWFESMEALNEKIQEWMYVYNHVRPHSSLQYDTPIEREDSMKDKLYFRMVAA